MYKSILLLLVTATVLFFIGYYFVFNTEKIITKYINLTNYKLSSNIYNLLTRQSNILWMKITGYGIILFALITLILMMILIYNNA